MDSERAIITNQDARTPLRDGPGLRVLVVEDDDGAATSAAMLLSILGHDAQIASDGAATLGAVSAYNPDVVLLDIRLPDLDGFEVAKRLRNQVTSRRPFLIAMTGGWAGRQEYFNGLLTPRIREREPGSEHATTAMHPHDYAVIRSCRHPNRTPAFTADRGR
jgi:response regulator RpfG family c-di-GMP phosphodiesterase